MSDTPLTNKAKEAVVWLIENRLSSLLAASGDNDEVAEQLWFTWRTILAVRRFEESDYLLNPHARDIDLLLALPKELEQTPTQNPEAQNIQDMLAVLIDAVRQYEFRLETPNWVLAVLIEYKPEPPHWGYVAGEIVEPDDQRLTSHESWQLLGSQRHALSVVKSSQQYQTVSEAHRAAVEHLERHYG